MRIVKKLYAKKIRSALLHILILRPYAVCACTGRGTNAFRKARFMADGASAIKGI